MGQTPNSTSEFRVCPEFHIGSRSRNIDFGFQSIVFDLKRIVSGLDRIVSGLDRIVSGLNRIVSGVLCDIPLGSHPAMYNMAEKYAKLGYKAELDLVEGIFTRALAEQKKTAAQPAQN